MNIQFMNWINKILKISGEMNTTTLEKCIKAALMQCIDFAVNWLCLGEIIYET